MAKPRGVLKFQGRLGDIVSYKLEEQWVTRKVGKLPKEVYAHAESFREFRNNSTEFSAASTYAKSIRHALNPLKELCFGSYIHSRLSGRLRTMIRHGSGESGRRNLQVEYLQMLDGFPLHRRRSAHAFLCTEKLLKPNREKVEIVLSMSIDELSFQLGLQLKGHQRLVIGVVALSELHFNDGYELLHPEWHGQAAFASSGCFEDLNGTGRVELCASLDKGESLPAGVGLVGVVGVV